jgi:hypothetical protein
MPTLTVSDATYQRIIAQAGALSLSVEQYLDSLGAEPMSVPLKGEEWKREMDLAVERARERARTRPPISRADDPVTAMYEERMDSLR